MTHQDLDYLARKVADLITERLHEPTEWVSQSKAWQRYGRASVQKLMRAGKVRTRKEGNQIQYYVKDLRKHSAPKLLIPKKS